MNRFQHIVFSLLIIVSGAADNLFAQGGGTPSSDPSTSIITFSGRTQIYGESRWYSTPTADINDSLARFSTLSQLPVRFARWEFSPTLTVLGLPFSADILYSTEDATIRQRINNYSFSLNPLVIQNYVLSRAQAKAEEFARKFTGDIEKTKDSLVRFKDSVGSIGPERLRELEETVRMYDIRGMNPRELLGRKDLMKQAGLLSSYEQIVMLLPKIGLGTNYPLYGEFMLNGVAVNGLDIEWNTGYVYMAYTRGTVLNPINQTFAFRDPYRLQDTSFLVQPVYERTLSAYRLGAGDKYGSHFILGFMKSRDDVGSVRQLGADSIYASSPQENYVFDADLAVNTWGGRINFNMEGAVSLFSNDITAPQINLESTGVNIPGILKRNVTVYMSSFYDWSVLGNLTGNIPESVTRFSIAARRVGTGFRSLGLINQRNDYLRYDIRADQGFLQRQLSVGFFIRRDRDNLIDWKRATSEISAFGITLGIMPRGLPFLRLMFSPYYQRNDSQTDSFKLDNATTLLSATVGYSYRIYGMSHSSTISYSTNSLRTYQGMSDFDLKTINLGHSTSFEFPLTLSLALGSIDQKSSIAGFESLKILSVDLSAYYTAWDVLNFGSGLSIANEASNNSRTGFYFSANAPIYNIAVFDMRAEKNVFRTSTTGASNFLFPYDETVIRATLSKRW